MSQGYSIELYFDPALENQVLKSWNVLARRQISTHLIEIESRPHIALFSSPFVDIAKLENVLRNFCLKQEPVSLSFSSVGSLPIENNVLFLGPTPTLSLLQFHSQLCDALKKEGIEIGVEYRPDTWIPYCSVAEEVPKTHAAEAFTALRELKLPVSGYGMDISLVEYPPVRELFSFSLAMGIIEDGTISGNLPCSRKVFAVHYPGYPSSIERAVETLGGTEGVLKVCTKKSNKLELHFRPEDPYSHPAFGELQPCNNFLLKISKKKVKSLINKNNPDEVPEHSSAVNLEQNNTFPKLSETSQVRPESEPHPDSSEVDVQTQTRAHDPLFADIVAQVSEAYHFNGMVDYQHVLAVHADNARRKKRIWDEETPQFRKGGLLDVDHEDLMMLVPPLFSTKDLPENVVLKPCSDPSLKRKQEVVMQQRWEMEIGQCIAIDFNINEIPKKVYWDKFIPRDSERWQWQTAVCELFDERPIWVKESLAEHLIDRGLNVGGNVLKRLLFIAAYYFSNGPFLRFWIKKGYDPRKDPESRIYQKTDFRVPPLLRSYCDANASSGLKNNWKDICAFEVFPYKCQVSLQLFELKDDYVQQEIRKPSSQESCSLQTGWFSSHVIDCLRLRVAQRFLTIYPEVGAESILKSVSRRFERSKKVRINLKDLKGDEGEQANEDTVQSEDKEPIDEVEYEEAAEEDEMEDENLGEGFDAAEVEEDMDFFLRRHSYTEHENISKDYLHELFGSFPFIAAAEGDDEMQGADPYDGEEYQIYEHHSDEGDEDFDDEEY